MLVSHHTVLALYRAEHFGVPCLEGGVVLHLDCHLHLVRGHHPNEPFLEGEDLSYQKHLPSEVLAKQGAVDARGWCRDVHLFEAAWVR